MTTQDRDTLTAVLSLYQAGRMSIENAEYLCGQVFRQALHRNKITELFPPKGTEKEKQ